MRGWNIPFSMEKQSETSRFVNSVRSRGKIEDRNLPDGRGKMFLPSSVGGPLCSRLCLLHRCVPGDRAVAQRKDICRINEFAGFLGFYVDGSSFICIGYI